MSSSESDAMSNINVCAKSVNGPLLNSKRRFGTVQDNIEDSGSNKENCSEEPTTESICKRPKLSTSIQLKLTRNEFLKLCLSMVVRDNHPFSLFDSRLGFRQLLEPYESFYGIQVTRQKIVAMVECASSKIKHILSQRLSKQLVSIESNIATKMGKSVLAINVQYIWNFKLCIHTLGMIQLTQQHTPEFIREEILKCLKTFGIDASQIYSNTTDHGVNLMKVSETLQALQEDELPDMPIDSTPEDAADEKGFSSKLASGMSVVRCASHALQLAAHDVLKTVESKIEKCRVAVTTLQTLSREGIGCGRMPELDNDARWTSTFDMLKTLLHEEEFIAAQALDKNIIQPNWDFVANFVSSFEPLHEFTKCLQQERYIIGDFYRDWLLCELKLLNLSGGTPYAHPLRKAMEARKEVLLQNNGFLAALYLDPRFNYGHSTLLSKEQKSLALEHLLSTYKLMKKIERTVDSSDTQETSRRNTGSSADAADAFEDDPCSTIGVYESLDQFVVAKDSIALIKNQTMCDQLLLLPNTNRLAFKDSALHYWQTNPCSTDMEKLVQIALAVPTQVSLERAFTALALVLTKSRRSDQTLNDILLLNSNFDLIEAKNVDIFDSLFL